MVTIGDASRPSETAVASGRTTAGSHPVPRYVAAPDGRLLEASDDLARLLGYPDASALIGIPACDFVVDDTCASTDDREVDLISPRTTGNVRCHRVQIRTRDGRLLWVCDTCHAVRDASGLLVRFEGSLRNGSSSPADSDARSPSSLTQADLRFQTLFESIPVGLYVTSPDGVILEANAELARMLECENKRELIGRNAADFYSDPADRCAQIASMGSTDACFRREAEMRTHTGKIIWVVDTCRGLRDSEGRVSRIEGCLRDVTEARELEQRLRLLARHDSLTGVFNRYALGEILTSEVARSRRYRHPIGVLLIDVDRFKEINDRFGHAAGDEILKGVATTLRRTVRDSDIVVRYGGDEFLVLLVETDGESIMVKKRIQAAVAHQLADASPLDAPVTVSIGAAHWSPDLDEPIETAIQRADAAMYAEKRERHAEIGDRN